MEGHERVKEKGEKIIDLEFQRNIHWRKSENPNSRILKMIIQIKMNINMIKPLSLKDRT